ncbi:MAG TPA: hypothetical protein ENK55_03165 [Actinobacteria bacterium]|nr:hypothetical protein [Actinomycetota bacterium]
MTRPGRHTVIGVLVGAAVVALGVVGLVAVSSSVAAEARTRSVLVTVVVQALVVLVAAAGAVAVYASAARRRRQETEHRLEAELCTERQLARAKGHLLAGISHELREPLTAIFGFSEYLVEYGAVDETEARELVRAIRAEAIELERMVEDLFVAARIDDGSLRLRSQEVAVADVVERVLACAGRTGSRIEVSRTDALVRGDPTRVQHVLRNLLSNALRHGGARIRIITVVEGPRVTITVADDGPGLPDDVADSFLVPSEEVGRRLLTGGSGLGLAVARALAEAMGGRLDYQRAMRWTAFQLRLPGVRRPEEIDVVEPRRHRGPRRIAVGSESG